DKAADTPTSIGGVSSPASAATSSARPSPSLSERLAGVGLEARDKPRPASKLSLLSSKGRGSGGEAGKTKSPSPFWKPRPSATATPISTAESDASVPRGIDVEAQPSGIVTPEKAGAVVSEDAGGAMGAGLGDELAQDLRSGSNVRAEPSVFARTVAGDTLPGYRNHRGGAKRRRVTPPENQKPQQPEQSYTPPSSLSSLFPSFPILHSIDLMSFFPPSCLTEAFTFTEPSPDDVVKNAQAGAKGFKGATKATGKDVTTGMKQLHLGKDQQQPPPPPPVKIKHKGLDVPAEYARAKQAGQRKKNAANFVVIGHVDAGKSTLMGRLLLDLNAVSQRQYSKQQTESANIGKNTFALAWTLDSTAEERARGVTIDVASTHFSTNSTLKIL
ncbi:Hsp70 suppressor, GTPase facilitates ribosomal subunit dissociation, partial [Ascosphaera atra]